MFNTSLKTAMQKVMTIKKVKTKTAIAVALVVFSAGSTVAGWYYYGSGVEHFASLLEKNTSVAEKTEKKSDSTTLGKSQAGDYMGKILGVCQVCSGKTYCKCECPKKNEN